MSNPPHQTGEAPAALPRSGAERALGRARRRPASQLRCDFCGEQVPNVRRVAIDTGYERLQTPHKELYACPPCSERKEQARLGFPGR